MALTTKDQELLKRVADEAGAPFALLVELARLEEEIPDLNLTGAKAELNRRVTAVLSAYAEPESVA